ncbi:MAG TPA: AEC family transporter [Rhodocyclaceae bacterium]|nr:AEC family transporter [Rhodocyclaceae bacterium]
MTATLTILLPIFGLILTGFIARRADVLGPTAASEINRFVAKLALPALLLHFTAHAQWADLDQPGFAATFALTSTLLFILILVWRHRQGSPLADASIEAIAGAYANTAYIGLPLCIMVFGTSSMAAATIASVWVVCGLFAIAIALIEVGLQGDAPLGKLAGKVCFALLKNPLITAPAAGALLALGGMKIPAGADTYLEMLGSTASPCALICIGLFLANKRGTGDGWRVALPLTFGKLIVMPLMAWFVAACLFKLPPATAQAAVLLAALPTGTGPFMLAELYRREARATSQTILLSTVGSFVTLSIILLFIHRIA